MATAVPIPMGIKDRPVYQALIKLSRALQRSATVFLEATGKVSITDNPSITNTANWAELESFEVDTGIPLVEYEADTSTYSFTTHYESSEFTSASGDAATALVVSSPIYKLGRDTIFIQITLNVRSINTVVNTSVVWKARKTS
tara:strand:+ start:2105 stop:2533 length:429 start_codon:yes stop_codon:yes gene_type:complete